MQIQIIEENINNFPILYNWGKSRLPSMTDVKFINENLIVAAHRYASKLYLIKIEDNNFKILDTIIIKYSDLKLTYTEAIIYHNNTIYCNNFNEDLIIIDIIDNKFKLKTIIKLNQQKIRYHGIKLVGDNIYFTPSNAVVGCKCEPIAIYNINTNEINNIDTFNLQPNYRIKDIIFFNSNLILLFVVYKTPTSLFNKNHSSDGFIGLFKFPTFIQLDKIELKSIHLDLATNVNNRFFVCGDDAYGSYIYYGDIVDNKIINFNKVEVAPFPHGIDIYKDNIAYTSYGDHSVYIQKLKDLIPEE